MKHTIRFIFLFLTLLIVGAGNVWSLEKSDIIINPALPNTSAGEVKLADGDAWLSGRTVKIVVTPASGFKTKKSLIIVEKMVDPTNRAPRRRAGIGQFELTGTDDWVTSATEYTFTVPEEYDGAYITATFISTATSAIAITSLSAITDFSETANYELAADIDASGLSASLSEFKGTLDGKLHKIYNLSKPLFSSTNGAIIRNITFEEVNIGVTGNAGAVTGEAKGASRIYNIGVLSGSVSGTTNVGGIVGILKGTSRVINCYSYANIMGGSDKAGIVGYNDVASTQSSLTTMVMNCMFYGDIVDGNTIAPIYGGTEINNGADGLNNYNYYRYRSRYSKEKKITKYNRALAMEEKFITRFERYRLLLNSNKKLAALYATGSADNGNQMAKWVLETADRSIIGRNPYPYPILKAQGYYPSIINYDAKNAPSSTSVGRLNGGKLGSKTLAVTISTKSQKTSGGQSWPTAAASDVQTKSLTLICTDKDTVRFNFNYDKVQLPYYNDIGTGNYTENRVVTGWKITSITGGTEGTYTESDSWGGYNFADRHCTKKDKYDISKRVFSQGAYWDVPEGVTAITIEPYWAIANYVSDETYDVVYNRSYVVQTFSPFGTQHSNGSDIDIYGDNKNQKVYSSIANAIADFDNDNKSVYDQAVVLVGNLHQFANPTDDDKPYTVMSIDMNHDNEPDYSYICSHDNRRPVSPIRFDFLNFMGIAEAQLPKLTANTDLFRNVSIFNMKGWFEITNTCVVNFSQLEYDNSNGAQNPVVKSPAPLILLGGTYEQIVSTQKATLAYNTPKTKYIHVGGNAWFAKFGNGTHSDGNKFTPHVPISVTGGDYDEFYLSGTYQPNITNMQSDNAECYVSGGRFGDMAGASLEAIWGDVRWDIDYADITNFYGGGVNANNPITGNIRVDMARSHVGRYCGGPKFGDMSDSKNVLTNATDCTFGTFFGAGFGGNSYNRVKYWDVKDKIPSQYQYEYANDRGKYYDGSTTYANDAQKDYGKKGKGVATDFDYDFFIWSSGVTGARFYVQYISFSLARTNNVTSNLTGCTINENFYGGGNLGKVNNIANSTLNDCTVKGNVFGGGYSATLPKIGVRNTPAFVAGKEPRKNINIGMFEEGEIAGTVDYEWKHVDSASMPADGAEGMESTSEGNFVYTDEDLNTLGQVGTVNLTITGTTTVDGSVYGGGEESGVGGDTQVFINNGTIGTGAAGTGNVFGAGKGLESDYTAAVVKGNSTITMSDGTVKGNIYGGGELSSVGTFTFDTTDPTKIATWTDNTGKTTINISGGTIGNDSEYTYDAENTITHTNGGNVFAGSKGSLFQVGTTTATSTLWSKFAKVKNTEITISDEAAILSNVYGGGEIGSVGYDTSTGAVGGTEITINGGTIGTEIKDGTTAKYTFGSVFGGGYGSPIEELIYTPESGVPITTNPKLDAGIVYGSTKVTMNGNDTRVWASVYGGGELASVKGNPSTAEADVFTTDITINGGHVGRDKESANKFVSKAQFGGATMGNVYGGGKGHKEVVRAGQIKGNTKITITGGTIYHNVYGGGAYATVGDFNYGYTTAETGPYAGIPKESSVDGLLTPNTGFAKISITGGTIGVDGLENGMVFGSSRGDVGEQRDLWLAWVDHTKVEIGSPTAESNDYPLIRGSVYGSGENGHVYSNTDVIVHSGTIGIFREHDSYNKTRGNVYGGGCGEDTYPNDTQVEGMAGKYEPTAGIVYGTAKVTVDGGIVKHNIYGAGALGSVGQTDAEGVISSGGTTTIVISGGTIGYDGVDNGNVYGAARGNVNSTQPGIAQVQTTGVTIQGTADIKGSVYGGGEAGTVLGAVTVNMTGGNVVKDVYGGGALANTNTANWGTDTWADAEKKSALYTTAVNLTGGTVTGNVYGGGLGKMVVGEQGKEGYEPAIEAKVYGNTAVELNKTVADDAKGCVVKGSIFGCNNLNGTPMGDVKVHIFKTQNEAATRITNAPAGDETPAVEDAKVKDRYDVLAVYGGGNQSAYEPVADNNKTEVIIDGCDRTSIRQVYGGGNAACTPATNVTVNGTFEIYELFGGGNGLDNIFINGVEMPNPGANVGYRNYSEYYKVVNTWKVRDMAAYDTKDERMAATELVYGTGKASVTIYGGTVHRVFGGSNTKGNVRQTAVTLLDENSGCDFCVDEAYGGGKSAEMDAEAQLLMACIPGLASVYGGAEAADVRGNVTLNITNGTFDRVFGGNNLSGTINGSITVNIEETGCKPIKIGELYGGGNQAGYSVYGYDSSGKPKESGTKLYDDPQVNVKSFTSIGKVFGGGYGDGATMVGNPTVNINVANGKYYDNDLSVVGENEKTPGDYPIPSHAKGKMGAISNVFGGGNAAKVIGNTNVNIGTQSVVYIVKTVAVGSSVTDLFTRNNDGTYTEATGTAQDGTTYYEQKTVLGADIRGNVYGGGNNAEVTGATNVTIGKPEPSGAPAI